MSSRQSDQSSHVDSGYDVPRPARTEQFIGTVDVWRLERRGWPIMRILMPGYVEHLQLNRHLGVLLATGRWSIVSAVAHLDTQHKHPHLFDVYGRPA